MGGGRAAGPGWWAVLLVGGEENGARHEEAACWQGWPAPRGEPGLTSASTRRARRRYLQQPGAFHGGGCGCGCGTDWERWVAPPAASRAAREQQLRDPLVAAKARRGHGVASGRVLCRGSSC